MENYEVQEEISLFELFDLIRRNLVLILVSVVVGLVLSLGISGVSAWRNPITYTYTSNATVSLVGEEVSSEQVKVSTSIITHPEVLKSSLSVLKITEGSFVVRVEKVDDSDIFVVKVTGPTADLTRKVTNEILNQSKLLIDSTVLNINMNVLELGDLDSTPAKVGTSVNWILNAFIGMILGGMLSVFYVFGVYFVSPNMIDNQSLERLLDSKVIGSFVETKQSGKRKLFEVR